MPFDAIISISGILVCLVGLVHVVIAYRQTTRSAEPDPQRVKRFVESALPIPGHLLYAHQDQCPDARPSRAQEAEPGEKDAKDHEAPR
ncbi:hypothetical protein [Salipiger bermudensis]|uniref:hypothetical protein n=1 Tax=Salipiger bermudensis TaxID=344736 RepID=UPI001CD4AF34|nr:hypothetical protein [Salipiger bermudensis]MCA0964911.1 hypothetical protein [Salipiger bermudensis]